MIKESFIDIQGIKIKAKSNFSSSYMAVPILMLHGFTGNLNDWDQVFEKFPCVISLDLIGHGKSSSPKTLFQYTPNAQCLLIKNVLDYYLIKYCIIIGYSMGSRLSINFFFRYPNRVKAMVLESGTPGISNLKQRAKRRKKDKDLAKAIEQNGSRWFAKKWLSQSLFRSQTQNLTFEKQQKILSEKTNLSEKGLANSLLGFGSGSMPSYWHKLYSINVPVLLITGELDKKFSKINHRMAKMLPNAKHVIIKGAGHNTHLEKTEPFTNFVKAFLKNLKSE